MEWTKIDPNNLPEDEVIATDQDRYMVGQLVVRDGKVICEGGYRNRTVMRYPEYYIVTSELERLPFNH
jgi:hypothetical protein